MGDKLRAARIKRGKTLEEVAKVLDISTNTLRRYENGEIKIIPPQKINELAQIYRYHPSFFYGWSGIPFLFTIAGMLLFTSVNGVSGENFFNGTVSGFLSGTTVWQSIIYFLRRRSYSEGEFPLTELEKELLRKWKETTYINLDTKLIFDEEEMKENEEYLDAFFYAHLVKRESSEKKDGNNEEKI